MVDNKLMLLDDKEFNDLALKVNTNSNDINNINFRMDSYHHDSKQRFDKIDRLLMALPTEDKIFRMFVEESRKVAAGLTKRDDEQELKLNRYGKEITDLEKDMSSSQTNQKWYSAIFAAVGTGIGAFIGKHFA